MTYYKYAERDKDAYVDWGALGQEVSKSIQDKQAERQAKRNELNAQFDKNLQTAMDTPTGSLDSANDFSLNVSTKTQETLKLNEDLFKSGEIEYNEYIRTRENVMTNLGNMFGVAKEYQNRHAELTEQYQNGELSVESMWEMEQIEGLARMENVDVQVDPYTGRYTLNRFEVDDEGNRKVVGSPLSVQELKGFMQHNYSRFKVGDETKAATDRLGDITKVMPSIRNRRGHLDYVIEQSNKMGGDYTLEEKEEIRNYLTWEENTISSMLDNPHSVASILANDVSMTDDGQEYEFTFDKEEWEKDKTGRLIYKDRAQNGKAILKPEQQEKAEDYLKTALRSNISQTEGWKSGGRRQEFNPNTGRNNRQNKADAVATDAANLWAQVFYGSDEDKERALQGILSNEFAKEQGISSIDVRPNPNGEGYIVEIENEDPSKSRTVTYNDDTTVEEWMNIGQEFYGSNPKVLQEVIKSYGGSTFAPPSTASAASRAGAGFGSDEQVYYTYGIGDFEAGDGNTVTANGKTYNINKESNADEAARAMLNTAMFDGVDVGEAKPFNFGNWIKVGSKEIEVSDLSGQEFMDAVIEAAISDLKEKGEFEDRAIAKRDEIARSGNKQTKKTSPEFKAGVKEADELFN